MPSCKPAHDTLVVNTLVSRQAFISVQCFYSLSTPITQNMEVDK